MSLVIPLGFDVPTYSQVLTPPPALVRHGEPSWQAVPSWQAGDVPSSSPPSTPQKGVSAVPLADLGVELVLAEEGKDLQGRWFQRFEVTIKPGGTLADASLVLYGDERRAPELLELVRKRQPNIDAQHIPVGLKIGVTVDPSVAFVLKDSRREGDWEINTYYNGAVERRRANARVVELPSDKPAQEFAVPGDTSDRPVPAGARLLEYQYRADETFEQAVALIYGADTIKAMEHFISQTGVDVNNWPPPALDRLRIVVAPGLSFTDDPIEEVAIPSPPSAQLPPEVEQMQRDQDEQRRKAGIYRAKVDSYGATYRMRILDAGVSSRYLATLLYNDPERWMDVVQAAGFKVQKDQPLDNIKLQGREFELFLEYDEEWFPLGEPVVDGARGTRTIQLLDGTQVTTALKGANRVVILPSGFRKVIYQPIELSLALARVVAYVQNSGEDGAARLLWDWDPGVQRQSGSVLQTANLVVQNKQVLLQVRVEMKRSPGPDPVALLRQLSPCLFAAAAVFLGTLLVLVVGRASGPKPYRRRH
ncbi:MAG: hypothetical protein M1370_06405 [Bacteroidetes bacterium]|nr:hypothetical protein [Bacteroidota bacterium]MCL5025796.1 hypothetical protein [Chloroflexota bacterium]